MGGKSVEPGGRRIIKKKKNEVFLIGNAGSLIKIQRTYIGRHVEGKGVDLCGVTITQQKKQNETKNH